ncbi:MAG: hypothetical protein LBH40_00755 [Alphaproteobacteria bacterium]|jgi:hypothetical protein|nr:hypothetical protein [Alphaproteobacteria bacterium]
MQYTWNNSHIQANIIYFRFTNNSKNWIFSTLNGDVALIDTTSSFHKTYFMNYNSDTKLLELETPTFKATADIFKKTINIESKNNA